MKQGAAQPVIICRQLLMKSSNSIKVSLAILLSK